jgi:hypothetical protein
MLLLFERGADDQSVLNITVCMCIPRTLTIERFLVFTGNGVSNLWGLMSAYSHGHWGPILTTVLTIPRSLWLYGPILTTVLTIPRSTWLCGNYHG